MVCCVAIERSFLRSHLLPVVQLRNLVRNSPGSSETASSRHHGSTYHPNTQPEASISAFRSGSKKRGVGSRASKVLAASCTPFTNLQSPNLAPLHPSWNFGCPSKFPRNLQLLNRKTGLYPEICWEVKGKITASIFCKEELGKRLKDLKPHKTLQVFSSSLKLKDPIFLQRPSCVPNAGPSKFPWGSVPVKTQTTLVSWLFANAVFVKSPNLLRNHQLECQ